MINFFISEYNKLCSKNERIGDGVCHYYFINKKIV